VEEWLEKNNDSEFSVTFSYYVSESGDSNPTTDHSTTQPELLTDSINTRNQNSEKLKKQSSINIVKKNILDDTKSVPKETLVIVDTCKEYLSENASNNINNNDAIYDSENNMAKLNENQNSNLADVHDNFNELDADLEKSKKYLDEKYFYLINNT
jgi:hypothetical protein